jgi:hypothetical protein
MIWDVMLCSPAEFMKFVTKYTTYSHVFCYIIMHKWKVESRVQSQTGVHLEKFPIGRRTLHCWCFNFKTRVSAANSQVG